MWASLLLGFAKNAQPNLRATKPNNNDPQGLTEHLHYESVMKLTYFQLEPHLKQSLSPIYMVSGDEILLKQDAIHLIRKAAKQAGFSERIRITPEEEEQLYPLLYSPSLLAEKRLLELHFRDTKPNKWVGPILQEYANKPSSENILLIDMEKIDDKIAKSAWYRSLEKSGTVITIWPIPREQLPQWISQRAKRYKLQLHPDAAKLLADYVEGNLVAAAQTIEKIYLLKPKSAVSADIIQTILTDESRFTIFDLTESLMVGNSTRTFHVLENLKIEGIEPVLILWSITRELRLMAALSQELKQGISYETLFQKHRIFARRQEAIRRFLSRFNHTDCWHFLVHAAQIDRIIKGAVASNVWDNLQLFCLRML